MCIWCSREGGEAVLWGQLQTLLLRWSGPGRWRGRHLGSEYGKVNSLPIFKQVWYLAEYFYKHAFRKSNWHLIYANYIDMYLQGLERSSKDPEPKSIADSILYDDPLLYIYTSGTTGLPKVKRDQLSLFIPSFENLIVNLNIMIKIFISRILKNQNLIMYMKYQENMDFNWGYVR